MKSLVLMRSPTVRVFLVTLGVGLAERFSAEHNAGGLIEIERRCCLGEDGAEGGVGGRATSGKSNTWWVGRHNCCSDSEASEGLIRIFLSILVAGTGESVLVEPTECGGDGGR